MTQSIGTRIKELREEAGMTQTELAGDRFSTSFISRLESGERYPSLRTINALMVRLGQPLIEIAGEPVDLSPPEVDPRGEDPNE